MLTYLCVCPCAYVVLGIRQISTHSIDFLVDAIELHDDMHLLQSVFANPLICKVWFYHHVQGPFVLCWGFLKLEGYSQAFFWVWLMSWGYSSLAGSVGFCTWSWCWLQCNQQVLHGADNDILWLQRDFHIYIVNLFDTARVSFPWTLNYAFECVLVTITLSWKVIPSAQDNLLNNMVRICLFRFVQACDALGKPQRSLAYLLQTYCGVLTDKKYQVWIWDFCLPSLSTFKSFLQVLCWVEICSCLLKMLFTIMQNVMVSRRPTGEYGRCPATWCNMHAQMLIIFSTLLTAFTLNCSIPVISHSFLVCSMSFDILEVFIYTFPRNKYLGSRSLQIHTNVWMPVDSSVVWINLVNCLPVTT